MKGDLPMAVPVAEATKPKRLSQQFREDLAKDIEEELIDHPSRSIQFCFADGGGVIYDWENRWTHRWQDANEPTETDAYEEWQGGVGYTFTFEAAQFLVMEKFDDDECD